MTAFFTSRRFNQDNAGAKRAAEDGPVYVTDRGRPSNVLRRWFEEALLPDYAGRILAVDTEVARAAASLHVPDPTPLHDAFIAATALVNGLVVATGNVRDFSRYAGLVIHNPWAGDAGGGGRRSVTGGPSSGAGEGRGRVAERGGHGEDR